MTKMNNEYYDVGGITVIDYIKAKLTPEEYKGFLKGNIIKYVSRSEYKENEFDDLKKAQDYLVWLIKEVRRKKDV